MSAIVRNEKDPRLPATARPALMVLVRYIEAISAEIAALDTALRKENKVSELGPRLQGDCWSDGWMVPSRDGIRFSRPCQSRKPHCRA